MILVYKITAFLVGASIRLLVIFSAGAAYMYMVSPNLLSEHPILAFVFGMGICILAQSIALSLFTVILLLTWVFSFIPNVIKGKPNRVLLSTANSVLILSSKIIPIEERDAWQEMVDADMRIVLRSKGFWGFVRISCFLIGILVASIRIKWQTLKPSSPK